VALAAQRAFDRAQCSPRPVLDLSEHAWFNLTSANDAQAAWYIKANLWVGGQIVDQFDATSKRVDNFFSTNAFTEYMYGRKLLTILERLYHVTSGPELRAAELASDSFVPFVMGMSPVDAEHAAFEQLRLHGRLPPFSRGDAVGAKSLLLLKKLPDAYTFKQTRLDEWYKGEVKNEPAWSLVQLIKIIPQWLGLPPPSAHLAAFRPSSDFVAQANTAAAARQGRGPLPPGYIPKGACFLCGEQNCYVTKCTKFCPMCRNKHCPGLVPSKKCVIHADTMPIGATTTRFDGKPVLDKTLAFLCNEWRKHKAGRPRAHAADGGPAEEGLSQEELGDLELVEYVHAYAGSAVRFTPPPDFKWFNLDASSAEAHLWHHGAVAADVDTVCASVADAEPAAPESGEFSGLTVSKLDAAELDAAATAFLSAVSGAEPAAPEPGEFSGLTVPELDAAATAFLSAASKLSTRPPPPSFPRPRCQSRGSFRGSPSPRSTRSPLRPSR